MTAPPSGSGSAGPTAGRQPHDATIGYPGGLRARWRWGGSGEGAGGVRPDRGRRHARRITARSAASTFEELCRAELRIDGPAGPWTVRLASLDLRRAGRAGLGRRRAVRRQVRLPHLWVRRAGRGELRWSHRSASPLIAVFGSPRLAHVLVQAEIETFALEPDGTVGWRVAHSDVVTEAELVGGRLVLTSFGGPVSAIDPATGRDSRLSRLAEPLGMARGDGPWKTAPAAGELVDNTH